MLDGDILDRAVASARIRASIQSNPSAVTLRLLTPADCAAAPPRGYIVKGLIAPRDLVLVTGHPGTGKSVLIPLIGYMVALGRSMFGRRVRQGRVIYLAQEDPHGMRQRIAALRQRHGDAPDFLLGDGLTNLLDESGAQQNELVEVVQREAPALVVIDTLAAAFLGLQENDSEGMGMVIALARRLTALGPAVVIAHHPPKTGDVSRGHSSLPADADALIALERDTETRVTRGTLTKNRNGESGAALAFRIEAECIGTDDDGDALTAPVAVPTDADDDTRRPRLSGAQQTALTVLSDLIVEFGEPLPSGWQMPSHLQAVRLADWRDRCEERGLSAADKREDRRRSVQRAIEKLRHCDAVGIRDGLVWLLPSGGIRRPDRPDQPKGLVRSVR